MSSRPTEGESETPGPVDRPLGPTVEGEGSSSLGDGSDSRISSDTILGHFREGFSATEEQAGRVRTVGLEEPRSGTVLGDYRLIARLGEGGMGTVFRAEHLRLGRQFAIKFIAPWRLGDRKATARFLQEMRVVGQFDHPNLVRATDARQEGPLLYLVMELLEGLDLREVVLRVGPLPVAEACEVIRQAALGVESAHRRGVIHRDLKPSNLMLTWGGTVKVLDLGLARLWEVDGGAPGDELTHAGESMGTPDYMAPEQCLDARQVTSAADLYSLGCSLFHLLTGSPPFGDLGSSFEKMRAHCHSAFPAARSDLPPGLVAVLEQVSAKDPGDRPALAVTLAEALGPFTNGADLPGLLDRAMSSPRTRTSPGSAIESSQVSGTGPTPIAQPPTDPTSPPGSGSSIPLRVALISRRGVEPDEGLVARLEARFALEGHEVFRDRRLRVGVEWAREVERQMREADVVILLLSAASIQSEMLTWETQIAHDEAQVRDGKPRILPVRVDDPGLFPPDLACILDRFPYFLWNGPYDDDRLVADLRAAFHGPRPIRPPRPIPVGGLPLDSQSYFRRPTDDLFHSAIARRDSIVLIRGARQMGKTSLLARGIQRAREAGSRVVFTDFQKLGRSELQSAEALYKALGSGIADDLELDVSPGESWDHSRAPNTNFESFLRRKVFPKVDGTLIWALDEVDRLFSCDFGGEVFGLFRSWHNARAMNPGGPWGRLTLAISYATEAHLFITDINQSPFNVGTLVPLDDFTIDQVADLNRRYDFPLRTAVDQARFYDLVGGHPYLVNRGLFEMAENGLSLPAFEASAGREEGLFGDHLRRILVLLAPDEELCEVVGRVLRGEPCDSPKGFYRLRAAGIVAGESARDARPRCRLYADYLRRHLMPAEKKGRA